MPGAFGVVALGLERVRVALSDARGEVLATREGGLDVFGPMDAKLEEAQALLNDAVSQLPAGETPWTVEQGHRARRPPTVGPCAWSATWRATYTKSWPDRVTPPTVPSDRPGATSA